MLHLSSLKSLNTEPTQHKTLQPEVKGRGCVRVYCIRFRITRLLFRVEDYSGVSGNPWALLVSADEALKQWPIQ